MQFHDHGYVSGDPRIQVAAGVGINRPERLPDKVDVLIVGTGPAGMIAAAQLSQFAGITTRIIERRPGRLVIGQADGIQARSVETFQAFGFADRITAEAYRITEMAFWRPDPSNPAQIARAGRTVDDPTGISEFPHLIVNQARVLDYFAEFMANAPTRMTPDYDYHFVDLTATGLGEHPVSVKVIGPDGPRRIHAKYVMGADGARSRVRNAIGCVLAGDQANHAWGVMDTLAVTDFPDIRTKCSIQSNSGNILLIPREGGHLFRMYVDLGDVSLDGSESVRATTLDQIVAKANEILHPYRLDIKDVPWHSVYEVGHRLSDRFDDVPLEQRGSREPRVFIAGDACHTHSAKAGQGMNVSLQDGFNLGWKLGHVLEGRAPRTLLDTYSAERQVVARELIEFDRKWSTLMSTKPEDLADPSELEEFYVRTAEFPAGFMTEYTPSLVTGDATHQGLAAGYPVGRRFKSSRVVRVSDGNPIQLGHHARADGRWRIYVFADRGAILADSTAAWLAEHPDSPLAIVPTGNHFDEWFDVKIVYQQGHHDVYISVVPRVFLPETGPYGLVDYEKIYAVDPLDDIFSTREVDRDGAIVIVRPDQYVSAVLPLADTSGIAAFFRPIFLHRHLQA